MVDLAALSAAWLSTPFLCWAVGPMIAVNVGFFVAAGLFELLLSTHRLDASLLAYPSKGGSKSRAELLAATHARIPKSKQLWHCLRIMAGDHAVVNTFSLFTLMKLAGAAAPAAAWWPASPLAAAAQLLAMALIADFGLYWGHRVQHEFDFLWRFHRLHHSIDTPTPFSTMYIHRVDAVLQGSFPMAFSAMLVHPAPAVMYLAFASRVAENAFNHSGLDHWLVDLLTLKALPFRAPASFHDAHHKFSNHPRNARNYGETFWIWDRVFNTVNPIVGRPQGSKVA
jgi:sterol desaturase/sphingolipid hydroxylase (fatty acid hydroxylase superfamily)